jgi:hypothetical protein
VKFFTSSKSHTISEVATTDPQARNARKIRFWRRFAFPGKVHFSSFFANTCLGFSGRNLPNNTIMEEHTGDTLGRRFMAFWGTVGAILVFGVVLTLGRKALTPKDDSVADAGAAEARAERLQIVKAEQAKELNTWEEDTAKGTVRIPPSAAIGYAVEVISKQAESKSAVGVPGTAPPAGAPAAHDPNLSKFQN